MICISSVSKFCEDFSKIENYEKAINDTTQVWCCHHRLEISPMGNHFSRRYLIEQRLYYNQKPEALIFLTRSEHMKLHGKGKKFSEETKQKISKALTGIKRSEETRQKISEIQIGRKASEETKIKMSESRKGKHRSEETRKKMSEAQKGKPKSEETKQKISKTLTGRHWKLVDGKRIWG